MAPSHDFFLDWLSLSLDNYRQHEAGVKETLQILDMRQGLSHDNMIAPKRPQQHRKPAIVERLPERPENVDPARPLSTGQAAMNPPHQNRSPGLSRCNPAKISPAPAPYSKPGEPSKKTVV